MIDVDASNFPTDPFFEVRIIRSNLFRSHRFRNDWSMSNAAIFEVFAFDVSHFRKGLFYQVILRSDIFWNIRVIKTWFLVEPHEDCSRKVAPGMASKFDIFFTPDAMKDYSHELICTSERERVKVPIKCVGARALLDFPDFVDLETCPVKMCKSKTLLVRNLGKYI